ncbi:thermonuclease family protein [Bdellovibrio sp. SKB1291214]|uniref:thermonuclease family protein n=1 Tax=Bdellovibrio sp. SKB1291214 TaxID=1732569 RepID=UPI000B68F02E|nr:thermonuclease family protein [Bdellovibrio sp. SKB1291214]UYL07265.1 thermonuclease family protein [Bdellovibrio sp. SKB1291214]
MKLIRLTLSILLFFPALALAYSLQGTVINVHDGDTLTIQSGSDRYKVRFLGVDTPEVDYFGNTQGEVADVARDFVAGLVPPGSHVTVVYDDNGHDKHNRILGRVIYNNVEINREILKEGWGYMYFIYPFDKGLLATYSADSKFAVDNQRGLFASRYDKVLAPYDFRMKSRNLTGTNYVGDTETKVLYFPEDIEQIPVWRRVFFSDKNIALNNGYKFF